MNYEELMGMELWTMEYITGFAYKEKLLNYLKEQYND